ncbi:MAG: hypothetical protein LIP77_01515, partial [Planctomycetes bacterium]|nr:hypothetical protein [Planctomycetota bacterium]
SSYVRLASPALPYGIARFATEDVDVILVALGDGPPPAEFPLPLAAPPQPPPGRLLLLEDRP